MINISIVKIVEKNIETIKTAWDELNEDLSVKGFIETAAINGMLEHLQTPSEPKRATA